MIYHGHLTSRFEGATHKPLEATRFHALARFPDKLSIPDETAPYSRFRIPSITLRSGDRLSVFNSITAGVTLWKSELDFLKKDPYINHPMGINAKTWAALFAAGLPVKLTQAKTGAVIDGTLQLGMDRIDDGYYIHDFKGKGYDSTHSMRTGDTIEIFSGVTDGNIVWQGEIKTHDKPVSILEGHIDVTRSVNRTLQSVGIVPPTEDGHTPLQNNLYVKRIGNPLITPTITEIKSWRYGLPMMLERDAP